MRISILLFLRTNWRHLAEMLLASLLVNVFMLTVPLFSMLVYDKAMGNQVHDTLWALAVGVVLLLVLELVVRSARVYLVEHAGARWDAFLDERLMRGVLNAPLTQSIPTSDVLSKMREVSNTRDVLSAQSLLALADLPFVLLFVAIIAMVGGIMVLIPLFFGVLIVLVSSMLQRVSAFRQSEAGQSTRTKMALLVDVLATRDSLYGRPAARRVESMYRQEAQTSARMAARARWWAQLNQQSIPVVFSLSTVVMLVAGVYQVEAQALSVGGLIAINLLSQRLVSNLCSVAPLLTRWKEFTRALTGLGESVDLKIPAALEAPLHESAFATEGVRLEGLGFAYPQQQQPVLEGLSLHLRPGELVALVGGSGAGKSTLLRVLSGQLPHTDGKMVFGAYQVVDDGTRQWMCRQVSHKPQDPTFLGGTLREIVAAGDVDATDDALVVALRSAGLGSVIERGELGLNTIVGTNGKNISGGQRQMVALAASFFGRQPVLLLDEPTLGLDRVAQECVIDALPALKPGRCVVIATHAAEVIAKADRLVVLDRGRIVADGHPDKLLGGGSRAATSAAT